MNFRTRTPLALSGLCTLVFAAAPGLTLAADTTGTAAQPPAEPGSIRNSFITYREEPTACFNHEASGGQFTLATADRGAVAQLFYSVTYDGKKAAYRHEQDVAPQADGFDDKTTHSVDASRISTEVRSTDGAISVHTESACGKGPYVTRQMRVTNTGSKKLNEVKLLLTVNEDTLNWENETGRVDAEKSQVLINNPDKTQWVGVGAQPKPAFLTADDVMSVLDADSGSDWSTPSTSFTGNVAVQVGWQLGPLEPGQSKTVDATFANTSSEADLQKALTRQAFTEK